MSEDPELKIEVDKKRISVASSFRTLLLTFLMVFMLWTGYLTWVVFDCRNGENCSRPQGSTEEVDH